MKQAMAKTKRLAASKAEPANSDSNTYAKVPRNKKARTGVLPDCNQQYKKSPQCIGAQCYCMMCKKSGMPERKCKLHCS